MKGPAWRGSRSRLVVPLILFPVLAAVPGWSAPEKADKSAPAPAPAADAPAPKASLVDRLLWNARERTKRGIDEIAKQQEEEAVLPLDTALRLDPEDPQTIFNAGTAHLEAKREDAAALLDRAATSAPPELRPSALYNLGNARLGAGDPQGAVEAYEQALRLDPANASAKFNLELALREMERREQQQKSQDANSNPQSKSGKDPERKSASSSSPDSRDKASSQSASAQGQSPTSKTGAENHPSSNDTKTPAGDAAALRTGANPLPQFHDQPDMNAQQAAAILAAVDGLERQQRRERSEKAARAKAVVEKDW